jgi:hypothetical protein
MWGEADVVVGARRESAITDSFAGGIPKLANASSK